MADPDTTRLTGEVERLHRFLQDWISGAIAPDQSLLEAEFAGALAPKFYNVQPAGQVLQRADIIEQIQAMHGANPNFAIHVEDVRASAVPAPGLLLGTYIEVQSGARNSPADNRRLSSVLIDFSATPASWLFVHETWVDGDQIAPI